MRNIGVPAGNVRMISTRAGDAQRLDLFVSESHGKGAAAAPATAERLDLFQQRVPVDNVLAPRRLRCTMRSAAITGISVRTSTRGSSVASMA